MANKWVDKIIDISRVTDRMVAIKVLAQGIISSVISVFAPHCSLDDSREDGFYDSFISVVKRLREKKIAFRAGDYYLFTLVVIQSTMRTSMKFIVT